MKGWNQAAHSFNLDPFSRFPIVNIFRNFAGMVGTPFEIPGDHDVVRAAWDIFWIFHHVGDPFAEDGVPECIDGIITRGKF